jgi:hypothetical protein
MWKMTRQPVGILGENTLLVTKMVGRFGAAARGHCLHRVSSQRANDNGRICPMICDTITTDRIQLDPVGEAPYLDVRYARE